MYLFEITEGDVQLDWQVFASDYENFLLNEYRSYM